MTREKWGEMLCDANRADAGSAATVRNAERLVKVQVADVGADEPGTR